MLSRLKQFSDRMLRPAHFELRSEAYPCKCLARVLAFNARLALALALVLALVLVLGLVLLVLSPLSCSAPFSNATVPFAMEALVLPSRWSSSMAGVWASDRRGARPTSHVESITPWDRYPEAVPPSGALSAAHISGAVIRPCVRPTPARPNTSGSTARGRNHPRTATPTPRRSRISAASASPRHGPRDRLLREPHSYLNEDPQDLSPRELP